MIIFTYLAIAGCITTAIALVAITLDVWLSA